MKAWTTWGVPPDTWLDWWDRPTVHLSEGPAHTRDATKKDPPPIKRGLGFTASLEPQEQP